MASSRRVSKALILSILAFSASACASLPRGGGARGGETASLTPSERAAGILMAAGLRPVASSPMLGLSMTGTEWMARALALIAGARDYILVSTFLVTDHPNARKVFEALAEARARGVRVHVLTDSGSYYRTYPMSPEPVTALIPYVRSLGIPITEYNPIRGRRIFTLLGLLDRDHRKFWVVDGRLAVVGGQNIDFDSLRDPSESGCIDAMAEFSSREAIAELRDSFIDSWNHFSIDRLSPGDFHVEGCPSEAKVWLVEQGRGKSGRITAMFDALFARAEREIVLVQCYAIPTPRMLAQIREATARGVKVTVILSDGHVSVRGRDSSYYGAADLLKAGARVFFYESPERNLLHCKMTMADEAMVAIGSANYNHRSEVLSRETSVVFEDRASLGLAGRRLEELRPWLREIGAEEAQGYRGLPYFLLNLYMQVGG